MKLTSFKALDKKSKIEIAATLIMVLVFIVILANSIKAISKTKSPQHQKYLSPDTFKDIVRRDLDLSAKAKVAAGSSNNKVSDIIRKDLPWKRDPFSEKVSLNDNDIAISDISLEGILWHHGGEPSAIINGNMVTKNDKVGNFRILSIEKDTVILTDDEKSYELQL